MNPNDNINPDATLTSDECKKLIRLVVAAQAWADRCSGQAIIDCWDPIDRELYLAVRGAQ
jgi:hypothetical protein